MKDLSNRNSQKGTAIVMISLLTMLLMVAGVMFVKRAGGFLTISNIKSDSLSAQYQMSAAYETAKSKIGRATVYDVSTGKGMILNNRLRYADATAPTQETFNNLSNAYATNQLGFLKLLINQQAYSGAGVLNSTHEFVNFETAFPTTWTDPDLSDDKYFELKYTFTPLDMISQVSPQQLTFEYDGKAVFMADWGGGMLLEPAEIDRERGIILAELRDRDGAGLRQARAVYGAQYHGTIVGERLPIGVAETIQTADRALIAGYYKSFYRPERMVLTVVGTIDVTAITAQVQVAMGRIVAEAEPAQDPARGELELTTTEPAIVVHHAHFGPVAIHHRGATVVSQSRALERPRLHRVERVRLALEPGEVEGHVRTSGSTRPRPSQGTHRMVTPMCGSCLARPDPSQRAHASVRLAARWRA
jgi:hypothetical protein